MNSKQLIKVSGYADFCTYVRNPNIFILREALGGIFFLQLIVTNSKKLEYGNYR